MVISEKNHDLGLGLIGVLGVHHSGNQGGPRNRFFSVFTA